MRWENGKDFVEIVSGLSTDVQESVWHINTNVDWEGLPSEFRKQVLKSDEEGYENLKQIVSRWAERNEYKPVYSDTA